MIAAPVEFCGTLLAMALTAKTAIDRHFEVMDAVNTITSPADPRRPEVPKGALSFRNVGFAFQDAPDKPVLKDITLDDPRRARPWRWWASPAAARARCSSWSPGCTR